MNDGSIKIDITTGINTDGASSYGIIAYRLNPTQEVFRIDGISTDRSKVVSLIKMLADNNVSASHFKELTN